MYDRNPAEQEQKVHSRPRIGSADRTEMNVAK
jgi:hypothetical protein